MAIDTIYLDLDGVLVDWAQGVFDLAGVPLRRRENLLDQFRTRNKLEDLVTPYFLKDDIYRDAYEDGESVLWAAIAEAGAEFWANLPWTPGGRYLWENLSSACREKKINLVLMTSPARDSSSAAGRVQWIQRNIKGGSHDNKPLNRCYAITPTKNYFASPTKFLIDDSPRNIKKFKKAGGKGILYPQPWNTTAKLWQIESAQMSFLDVILDLGG